MIHRVEENPFLRLPPALRLFASQNASVGRFAVEMLPIENNLMVWAALCGFRIDDETRLTFLQAVLWSSIYRGSICRPGGSDEVIYGEIEGLKASVLVRNFASSFPPPRKDPLENAGRYWATFLKLSTRTMATHRWLVEREINRRLDVAGHPRVDVFICERGGRLWWQCLYSTPPLSQEDIDLPWGWLSSLRGIHPVARAGWMALYRDGDDLVVLRKTDDGWRIAVEEL